MSMVLTQQPIDNSGVSTIYVLTPLQPATDKQTAV